MIPQETELKTLLRALAAIALVASTFAVNPAPVAAYDYTDYNGPCNGDAYDPNLQQYAKKDADEAGVGPITKVAGRLVFQGLAACDPSNGKDGFSFAAIANLQQAGPGIVQLGIAKCASPTGWSCSWGGNGVTDFVYTESDGPSAFNHYITGGTLELFPTSMVPRFGHTYYAEIKQSGGTNTPTWTYTLTDETYGTSTVVVLHRHWNQDDYTASSLVPGSTKGQVAWWGFETDGSGDVMGYRQGLDTPGYLHHLAYWPYDRALWVYRSGMTASSCIESTNSPSYYDCMINTVTWTGDSIIPYTAPH